jgi:hypothetical protein
MGLPEQESGTTKKHYKGITVKVYLNEKRFAEEVKRAEKSGKRRMGLLLYTQKSHGFEWEKLANTDGLSRYYKMCSDYWQEHEAERLQEMATLKAEKQRIEEEMKRKGVSL